jgi:RimJ/RimL family protein N-acetyltransferase
VSVRLETERMRLRKFTPDDLDHLFQLDRDPDVIRYAATDPPDYETVRDRILPRVLRSYSAGDGLGYFAAVEKDTGEFLGWFQLTPREVRGEVELGYRLKKSGWGKGYATEGARALVAEAFGRLGVERVVAFALEANAASIRVMEKVGLEYEGTFEEPRHGPGARAVRYGVRRRFIGKDTR